MNIHKRFWPYPLEYRRIETSEISVTSISLSGLQSVPLCELIQKSWQSLSENPNIAFWDIVWQWVWPCRVEVWAQIWRKVDGSCTCTPSQNLQNAFLKPCRCAKRCQKRAHEWVSPLPNLLPRNHCWKKRMSGYNISQPNTKAQEFFSELKPPVNYLGT